MNLLLRAAMAAVSIASIPPAIAGEGGSQPNTLFTEVPGVIAEAPAQAAPSIGRTPHGEALESNASPGHTPWLFPPIGKYLEQHAGG